MINAAKADTLRLAVSTSMESLVAGAIITFREWAHASLRDSSGVNLCIINVQRR